MALFFHKDGTELKLKFRDLRQQFPHLFGHIEERDIRFVEVEGDFTKPAILIFPINYPHLFFLDHFYTLVFNEAFFHLDLKEQFRSMGHTLLSIPKNYKDREKEGEERIVKTPEILLFEEEADLIQGLKEWEEIILKQKPPRLSLK